MLTKRRTTVSWRRLLCPAIAFCSFAPSFGATTYKADTGVYQAPDIPRPALRTPITDPVFGSTITRWTDPSMLTADPGSPDGRPLGLRHEYDRIAALNCNNTMAALTALGGKERGAWFVYVLATGSQLMTIPGYAPGGLSFTWSKTDPYTAIFYNMNNIDTLNALRKTAGHLMTLPQYEYIVTAEEGTFSDDWHYAAVLAWKPDANWQKADLCVLDLQTKAVLGTIPDVATLPNWIGISPSGNYAVAMFDDYTKLYDKTMKFLRNLFPGQSHSDFAFDQNNDEVITYITWSSAQCAEFGDKCVLAKVRLSDGQKTMIADTKWKWGSHTSGIGTRAHPGWLLVSDYKSFHPPAAYSFTNTSPFQQEVFWLKMDGSGQVKRIAHHHSIQSDSIDQWGNKDYFAEPHTVSSWDGTTVGFASVWGTPGTHYDFYTVTGDWWAGASSRLNQAKNTCGAELRFVNAKASSGEIDFAFNLPRNGAYDLILYDIAGRKIWSHSSNGLKGLNHASRRQPAQQTGVGFIYIRQGTINVAGKFTSIK